MWNGSTWVRPAFWDGTEWRSYIDPVYDYPATSFDFAAGPEEWNAAGDDPVGWDPGGHITSGGATTFLYGTAYVVRALRPIVYDLEYAQKSGHALECRWRARVRPGTFADDCPMWVNLRLDNQYPVPPYGWSYDGMNEDEISVPADSTWRNYTQDVGNLPDGIGRGDYWGIDTFGVQLRTSRLGGDGTIGQYLDVSSFQLWDVTDNEPLMSLGNSLWEPRVWTGTQWV